MPKICNLKSRFFYGTTCGASANDKGKKNNLAPLKDGQVSERSETPGKQACETPKPGPLGLVI